MQFDFVSIVGYLAFIGLIYGAYQMFKAMKSGMGFDYMLEKHADTAFKILGFFSTVFEVVGLALMANAARDVPLFSSITRYGIIGIAEVLCTYMFMSKINNRLAILAKDGDLPWWERGIAVVVALPWFAFGTIATNIIFLLYLDSIYRVVFELRDSSSLMNILLFPHQMIRLEITFFEGDVFIPGTNIPMYSGRIEPAAWVMIYFTPFTSIFYAVFVMFSNKFAKETIRRHSSLSDFIPGTGSSGSSGSSTSRTSTDSGGSTTDSDSSAGTGSTDDSGDSSDSGGDDSKGDDSGKPDEIVGTGALSDNNIADIDYLAKKIKEVYPSQPQMNLGGHPQKWTKENIILGILAHAGIDIDAYREGEYRPKFNPDADDAWGYPGVTSIKVIEFFDRLDRGDAKFTEIPDEENECEAAVKDALEIIHNREYGVLHLKEIERQLTNIQSSIDAEQRRIDEATVLLNAAEERKDSGAVRMYGKQIKAAKEKIEAITASELNPKQEELAISVRRLADALSMKFMGKMVEDYL